MTWNYAYTPQIWPPAFTALVLIALAVYSYRRHSVPGTLPFAIALLLGALWMAGISLEVAAVDASAKIFWVEFQAIWLLPVATAVTCFLIEYAWPGHWLTRRNLALLSIPCLINVGMILTNDLHHLAWQGFAFDGGVIPLNGPGNWIFLVYAYGLGLLNLVVLTWLFIRSPQHRWPAAFMAVGQIGLRVVDCWGHNFSGQAPDQVGPYGAYLPDTTLDSAPADPSYSGVSFTFGSDLRGATFECQMDAGGWSSCTSPKTYLVLAAGQHTFDVRAINASGGSDLTPASTTWTVASVPPTPARIVDGGRLITCALMPSGAVDCWGRDPWQLTSPALTPRSAPVDSTPAP